MKLLHVNMKILSMSESAPIKLTVALSHTAFQPFTIQESNSQSELMNLEKSYAVKFRRKISISVQFLLIYSVNFDLTINTKPK